MLTTIMNELAAQIIKNTAMDLDTAYGCSGIANKNVGLDDYIYI